MEKSPEAHNNPESEEEYTLQSALEAADEERIRDWVVDYLESEGENQGLADKIKELEGQGKLLWTGPILFDLEELTPIVSPQEGEKKYHDADWEKHTDEMKEAINNGWDPTPLFATTYYGQKNSLADGNHRWEALRKAGKEKYWTIFFEQESSSLDR